VEVVEALLRAAGQDADERFALGQGGAGRGELEGEDGGG